MTQQLELLSAGSLDTEAHAASTLAIANDADPREADLAGVHTVTLSFPGFSDGRAFSQAFLLRRRMGFTGHIRATGDVLIDQLQQMQRSGFSQAVLRSDQDLTAAARQLARFSAFYQGDAVHTAPRFAAA